LFLLIYNDKYNKKIKIIKLIIMQFFIMMVNALAF
jgi:hypothetical protein